jgi:hypothetical protein
MASLTWLDFSEQDRQRALDVLDLFREKGTVDELGIGTVRDALADVLFPGTSTIMTRARYYLFITWMYQELERKRISSSEIAQRGRKAELALIEALYAAGEREGLIGVEARKTLKRLPSTIYWQGLGILGMRKFPGSRERYHRALDRLYRDGGEVIRGDDGHALVGGRRTNWDPQLPPPPADFPTTATFELTSPEATYFRERVMNAAPHSYFAYLVSNIERYEDKDLPWDAPLNSGLPPATASELQHARNFSDAMHGSALIYNLMLAEQGSRDEEREFYREQVEDWSDRASLRMPVLASWSRSAFWALVDRSGRRVPPRTRHFVNTWLDRLVNGEPRTLADDQQIRAGIRLRERQLKGSLARLENARALERWGGASSAAPLDFRWNRPTRTLLADLKNAVGAS